MLIGAVLGVIVGASFAFYGLPPILRSIYGETKVAAGGAYTGDAKEVRIERVEQQDGVVRVTLSARTNKTWAPRAGQFALELAGGGDWIEAEPPDEAEPATSLEFELGERRELVLVFRVPPGREGEPEALHLSTPRVRFALAP